jgi:hypothetical protein
MKVTIINKMSPEAEKKVYQYLLEMLSQNTNQPKGA